ncbi:MAG: protein translocase subunit SecF, partial [Actinobacteria bacterium]|nr:protein translocase subunit SecF [Actinomycetota bacterium]
MQIFHNPNYNFVKWRWHAIAFSWIVIVAGLLTIWQKGLPLGVEFSGGSIVIVKFDKAPEIPQVRAALERAMPGTGQNSIVQRYGDATSNQLMIRVPSVGAEAGGELSKTADAGVAALNQGGLGINGHCLSPAATNCVAGTEIVGPIVGRQLTRQGTLATVLALGGILLYVAMRFQLSFAVGAVVATVHDLLVTFAVLAFFRYDLSLNVIAAILTITGYSVNDTIVIFDRVRENMRGMRRDNIAHIVNVAVNQALGRTILTAGTTLMSVMALYLFGGEVLRGFAFTMLVGVITGTYSSV